MKRRVLDIVLAAMACGLVACTAASDEPTARDAQPMPIVFALATDETTRADGTYVSGTSLPVGQQLGLFGLTTDAAPAQWLFYNEPLTVGSGGTLSYAPLHYWPNNGATVSFYAYYPYSATHSWTNGILVDQQRVTGSQQVIEFRQQEDVGGQVDLMVCNPLADQAKQTTSEQLSLTFRHALAKVTIGSVTFSGGSATLRGLQLKNVVMSQLLDFSTDYSAASWLNHSAKYGYATYSTLDNLSEQVMLLIPQDAANVKVVVTYDEGGITKTKEKSLHASPFSWAAGQQYTYNLTIAL